METTSTSRTRWRALRKAATWAAGRRSLRLLAVALIVALDSLIWRAPVPEVVLGAADEFCHLATAALIVLAWPEVVGQPRSVRLPAVLAASVLIDLDHLPKAVFGTTFLTAGTYRPYGHTALAVLLICAIAVAFRRSRTVSNIAWGAAVGVVLHLIRDLATGGAALGWPVTSATVAYPYPFYVLVLLLAAGWPRNRRGLPSR